MRCPRKLSTSGKILDLFRFFSIHVFIQAQKESVKKDQKMRPLFRLANRLIQAARSSKLDQAGLREYLKVLKESYFKEMRSSEEW